MPRQEAENDGRADQADRADDREARQVALHDLRRSEARRADPEGAREAGVLARMRQHEDDHAKGEQHVQGDRSDADDLAHALTLPAPASQNRRRPVSRTGQRDAPHDVGADRGPRHPDHVGVARSQIDSEGGVGDARAEHERGCGAPAALELEDGREQLGINSPIGTAGAVAAAEARRSRA